MVIPYEELSELDESVTVLARVTSAVISSTKTYYDPLKDFIKLKRVIRKSLGNRGKEFSPMYIDSDYRTLEILAIYQ